MNLTHSNYRYYLCITLFYLFSLAFYFAGPIWITSLFNNENFDLLNILAQVETNQVLDYYLGTIEENITGPLRFLFSGSAFLVYALTFLTESSLKKFISAVFFYFLLSRPEVLNFPPYGDPISGPWAEALWLAKNNFDYVGLYHQPEYAMGGPKVYLFSIYPTYLAILLKLIPSTKIFLLINHLLTFLMAATTVGLLRDIALKIFDKRTAVLVSLALLFLPLFQSGSELLNMEMPNTFFAVLTFHALATRKFGRALIFAILSTLTKAPGLIAALTVALATLVWAAFHKESRIKNIILSFLSFGFAYGFVYIKKFVNAEPLSHNAIKFMAGLGHIQHCPVIVFFSTFSLLVLLTFFIFYRGKNRLEHFWIPLLSLCFMLGWLALYLNFSVLGPRYKIILAPFLLLSTSYGIYFLLKKEKILHAAYILLCGVLMFCVYGVQYGERLESKYYSYTLTERSLEYRNDLKLYQKVAQTLTDDFPGFTAGVPFVMAQTLVFPELDYVKKPIKVVLYGMSVFYSEYITNFNRLANLDDFYKTVWVGFKSDLPMKFSYPIAPTDKVIEEIIVGNKKATLFYGGISIDKMYKFLLLKGSSRL